MKTATVSTQGRITIPAELRRKYGINPGTRIAFRQVGNAVEVRPITSATIDSLRGILQNKPGEKPVMLQLVEAHAAEAERDEAGFSE